MTWGGFLVMMVSIASVTFLFSWSVYKVISTPESSEESTDSEVTRDIEEV